MRLKDHWFLRYAEVAFFGLVLVNLLYLNYITIRSQSKVGGTHVASSSVEKSSSICDKTSCVPTIFHAIYEATTSQKLNPQANEASKVTDGKEYYVAFGGGSNATDDWADVGGASAYVDTSTYGRIQSVTFEASVSIPTGNQKAYVRLYNKTDKHPVWFSEVSLEGGTPQLLISSPITLDKGEKLYLVQMKTQLKYPANLTQARVRIRTY